MLYREVFQLRQIQLKGLEVYESVQILGIPILLHVFHSVHWLLQQAFAPDEPNQISMVHENKIFFCFS